MQLLLAERPGPAQLIDLRSVVSPTYPSDVTVVRHDPVASINSVTDAMMMADTLLGMSSVSISGNVSSGNSTNDFWEIQAAGPLAGLLFAASPRGNNLGMHWVLEAAENSAIDDTIEPDPTFPGWVAAVDALQRAGDRILAAKIITVLKMEPKQRDSVLMTVGKAIMPWLRTYTTDAALPSFDPAFLDDPAATLYVLAPTDGSSAGNAITLIDNLVNRQRQRVAEWDEIVQLMFCLDEFANTAPVPKIAKYVNEGRGLGCSFIIALQASSTIDQVYGVAYGKALRDSFPAVLVMYGADEPDIVQSAAHWAGLATRRGDSYTITGDTTNAGHFGAILEWQELLPQDLDHARLIRKGTPGRMVEMVKWETVISRYKRALAAAAVGDPQPIARPRDQRRGLMIGGLAASGLGAGLTTYKLVASGWIISAIFDLLFPF